MMDSEDSLLNIAAVLVTEDANAPGRWLSIHFQGCNLACPGCYNPQMWNPEPRFLLKVKEILSVVASTYESDHTILGCALLGGEPLQQPATALETLCEGLARLGKGILLFTGYAVLELESMPLWHKLRPFVDVSVAGRFLASRLTRDGYPSSDNQKLSFLSGRYANLDWSRRMTAVGYDSAGKLLVTGYPLIEKGRGSARHVFETPGGSSGAFM